MGDEILPAGPPHTGNRLPVISIIDNRQASNDIGGNAVAVRSDTPPAYRSTDRLIRIQDGKNGLTSTHSHLLEHLTITLRNFLRWHQPYSDYHLQPRQAGTSLTLPYTSHFYAIALPSHLIPTDFLFIRQPYSRAGILPFFIHRIPLP